MKLELREISSKLSRMNKTLDLGLDDYLVTRDRAKLESTLTLIQVKLKIILTALDLLEK